MCNTGLNMLFSGDLWSLFCDNSSCEAVPLESGTIKLKIFEWVKIRDLSTPALVLRWCWLNDSKMLLRPRQQAWVPVGEGTWHNPILQPLRCAVSLSGGFTGVTQVARCWSKEQPWRLSCSRVISSYKYLAAHQVHASWLWPRRSPQTLCVKGFF